MKYYKIIYENGYCGCNQEEYWKIEDDEDIEDYINMDSYSFFDDDRFIDDFDENEYNEYLEALEEYQENCTGYAIEISKEEFENNT